MMGSGDVETSVSCGGGGIEVSVIGFGGGSAKSKRADWLPPDELETRTYLRKLVADLPAAIRHPLVALRSKLLPPRLILIVLREPHKRTLEARSHSFR